MSEKELPNFAQNLLNKVARENGFSDHSIEINHSSKPTKGVAGELFRLKIFENKTSNEKKILNLICKVAPYNANYRKLFCIDVLFRSEDIFYSKLMPAFDQFQVVKNVSHNDRFHCYPKCYGTWIDSDKEEYAIILEDLQSRGFESWPRFKPSPIEHVRMSMHELGKFHGLSYAMKDQQLNDFAEYRKLKIYWWTICQSESMRAVFIQALSRAIDTLTNNHHRNILRHVKNNFMLYLKDCFVPEGANRLKVICHGDFWLNNILYRHDKQGNLTDIQILDYQTIAYVSPAYDIFHNIFNSTDKALRDAEFDNLLTVYYESLSKTIRLLGSNLDKLFTFANLKNELKRFGNYALIMGPLWIMETQEQPGSHEVFTDDMFDKPASEKTAPSAAPVGSDLGENGQAEFARRINELMEDVVRYDYYRKIE